MRGLGLPLFLVAGSFFAACDDTDGNPYGRSIPVEEASQVYFYAGCIHLWECRVATQECVWWPAGRGTQWGVGSGVCSTPCESDADCPPYPGGPPVHCVEFDDGFRGCWVAGTNDENGYQSCEVDGDCDGEAAICEHRDGGSFCTRGCRSAATCPAAPGSSPALPLCTAGNRGGEIASGICLLNCGTSLDLARACPDPLTCQCPDQMVCVAPDGGNLATCVWPD